MNASAAVHDPVTAPPRLADPVATARRFADHLARDAAERDAARRLPHAEVAELKSTGLLTLSVPARFGGQDAPAAVVAEVFRTIAHADPSVAQIPHSHYTFLEALRLQGSDAQQRFFYGAVRDGALFANAQTERGPHAINVDTTTLTGSAASGYVLTGRKFYATGSLFADWLIVRASLTDGDGTPPDASTPKALAFIPRDAAGVQVVDDWDGLGQRTTASGTVTLDHVRVPADHVVPFSPIFTTATVYGAHAQLLHTAIDVGIATGALEAGVALAATARPHVEAGVESAAEDPTLIALAGDVTVTVRAARALLGEAAREIDRARADLTDDTAAAASIAVAVAKVAAVRASLEAANAVFDLGGTRSATANAGTDRFWRDARTHTLHDATRWKLQHIGRHTLSGTRPPRHGQI